MGEINLVKARLKHFTPYKLSAVTAGILSKLVSFFVFCGPEERTSSFTPHPYHTRYRLS